MSVFNDAMKAVQASDKAKESADKAFEAAKTEWEALLVAYKPEVAVGSQKIKDLIKKYGPIVAKYFGVGGVGTVAGAMMENEGLLSGFFNRVLGMF